MITLLAVGCITPAHAAEPHGDGGTVRLVFNPSGTQSFPPYVIKKFALDTKYGFTLETILTASAQANVNAVQAHGTDIALFGWNDIARMRQAGVKIVGIAPFLTWVNTVMVPLNSPIQTLADLRGKKIGIYARANLDWIVMRAVTLKDNQFDLEKASEMQEGAITLLWGLMERGQLDAIQMYNSLTPAMLATGKFRLLATIRGLVEHLGLPAAPFILYTVDTGYAAEHPANVRAYLAAYREAIDILEHDDQVWIDHGHDMKLDDAKVMTLFRDEARADMISRFGPTTEADIRKTFDVLLATAGPDVMGMSTLPDGFMTLSYQ